VQHAKCRAKCDAVTTLALQVTLLVLASVGLLCTRWLVTAGPVALLVPIGLLASPLLGKALRGLLREGITAAQEGSRWLQQHRSTAPVAAQRRGVTPVPGSTSTGGMVQPGSIARAVPVSQYHPQHHPQPQSYASLPMSVEQQHQQQQRGYRYSQDQGPDSYAKGPYSPWPRQRSPESYMVPHHAFSTPDHTFPQGRLSASPDVVGPPHVQLLPQQVPVNTWRQQPQPQQPSVQHQLQPTQQSYGSPSSPQPRLSLSSDMSHGSSGHTTSWHHHTQHGHQAIVEDEDWAVSTGLDEQLPSASPVASAGRQN
jgi:hypothetical protein